MTIAMVLALGMNVEAAAQKHRHTPRTEQVDSTKAKDAIEAFSDTTAIDEEAEDDSYVTRSVTYSSKDAQELKEVMDAVGGTFAPWVAVSIVSIVVIFLLAPLLIILVVFYFVNKNRKERYKLAQMAIQNGQPSSASVSPSSSASWQERSASVSVRSCSASVLVKWSFINSTTPQIMSTMNKRLMRSNDRVIAGVCGGLAEYFDFDPVMVRIAYAFLTLFTAFCGLIFYIVLWIVMPEKRLV